MKLLVFILMFFFLIGCDQDFSIDDSSLYQENDSQDLINTSENVKKTSWLIKDSKNIRNNTVLLLGIAHTYNPKQEYPGSIDVSVNGIVFNYMRGQMREINSIFFKVNSFFISYNECVYLDYNMPVDISCENILQDHPTMNVSPWDGPYPFITAEVIIDNSYYKINNKNSTLVPGLGVVRIVDYTPPFYLHQGGSHYVDLVQGRRRFHISEEERDISGIPARLIHTSYTDYPYAGNVALIRVGNEVHFIQEKSYFELYIDNILNKFNVSEIFIKKDMSIPRDGFVILKIGENFAELGLNEKLNIGEHTFYISEIFKDSVRIETKP